MKWMKLEIFNAQETHANFVYLENIRQNQKKPKKPKKPKSQDRLGNDGD